MNYIFNYKKYKEMEKLEKEYDSVLKDYDGWVVYAYDDKPDYGELCGLLVRLDWCDAD